MRRLIGLALLFGASVPASAADIHTLECVRERLDATAVSIIAAHFEALMRAPDEGPLPQASEAEQDALQIAAHSCAKTYGWTDQAALAALNYAQFSIARPVNERVLDGLGMNSRAIAALYEKFPVAAHETRMPAEPWPEVFRRFSTTDQGLLAARLGTLRKVGRYLGNLNMLDFSRVTFLRN